MANLASAVWQDDSAALILGLHNELAPTDDEWDRYCASIPAVLEHPNACSMVLTDGGAPTNRQREQLRTLLGSATRWTAVVSDKAKIRGVVTAMRWFHPKVCAFTPWEFPQAFTFIGMSGGQIRSICQRLDALDVELSPRSRVLAQALQHIDWEHLSPAGLLG